MGARFGLIDPYPPAPFPRQRRKGGKLKSLPAGGEGFRVG